MGRDRRRRVCRRERRRRNVSRRRAIRDIWRIAFCGCRCRYGRPDPACRRCIGCTRRRRRGNDGYRCARRTGQRQAGIRFAPLQWLRHTGVCWRRRDRRRCVARRRPGRYKTAGDSRNTQEHPYKARCVVHRGGSSNSRGHGCPFDLARVGRLLLRLDARQSRAATGRSSMRCDSRAVRRPHSKAAGEVRPSAPFDQHRSLRPAS